jgi:predicted dehydrogenase
MIARRQFLQMLPALTLVDPAVRRVFAAQHAKIKAGQIGTKHAHASGKIGTMRKFSDLYDFVGVVEPDDKRWSTVKDTPTYKGVPRLSEEQLLGQADVQLVAVETEVRQLLEVADRCVQAGKHIHLDKPAGEDLAHFEKILKNATIKRLNVQMGYMFRYNPGFQFLFKAIREGWLGEIFEVHTVMSKKVNDATRRQLAEYPGGTMFELGCHIIDAVVTALGQPDKVTAYTRRTRDQDPLADNQLAVFEYPKATATVRSSVVEVNGGRRRQFVACGTKGSIEIIPLEAPQLVLTLDEPQGEYARGRQSVELPVLGGRYDGDFLDLARVLHGEKPSDFPPQHDLAVQKAVLQASGVRLVPK